jgi:hypothetical protein
MTKINGTEPAVYDPSVAQGYVHVSAALVDAACNAWFARKGIRYQALGRTGLALPRGPGQPRRSPATMRTARAVTPAH